MSINMPAYSQVLLVLGTAGIIVPMAHRYGLSPVLAYLGAGAVLGPFGLGSLAGQWPILNWMTISDARHVSGIADLGVVFLLFLIGLELSYERLRTMRRLVLGLGASQVAVTTALIATALKLCEQPASVALILGACLSLSSTAIVLEVLARHGRLATSAGRTCFAVLLAQDLAVIPLLMLLATMGASAGTSLLATIVLALTQALVAIGCIVVVGRALLRPLFRLVAHTGSSELFIATTLFVIVATAVLAAAADVSMALGAFVTGLLLAETEYRKAIEATIEPFKGLLLGVFFFTVGMGVDIRELFREPLLVLASVLGLIILKAIIVTGLARLFKVSWPSASETGLLLGPGGEFAFVGIGLAGSLGVLPARTASLAIAVASFSMALIPALALLARRLSRRLEATRSPVPALTERPAEKRGHAIVVGFGRVGRVVSDLLTRHDVNHIVIDHNAATVVAERAKNQPVYFGDATSPAFLKACGIAEASAMIITIHANALIDEIVRETRELRPDLPIIVRARDAEHARHLYTAGVTDAVPETIEASLQLCEAALVGLAIPTGLVIASIHERRDEFRHELQTAARQVGRLNTRSVRASTRSNSIPADASNSLSEAGATAQTTALEADPQIHR